MELWIIGLRINLQQEVAISLIGALLLLVRWVKVRKLGRIIDIM